MTLTATLHIDTTTTHVNEYCRVPSLRQLGLAWCFSHADRKRDWLAREHLLWTLGGNIMEAYELRVAKFAQPSQQASACQEPIGNRREEFYEARILLGSILTWV